MPEALVRGDKKWGEAILFGEAIRGFLLPATMSLGNSRGRGRGSVRWILMISD